MLDDDDKEIPPLTEPLFDGVTITPSRPEKCVVLTDREAYGDYMGPPVSVAELTTYGIELHLKDKDSDPKLAEKTRHALERWMKKVMEGEPIPFYSYADRQTAQHVTIEGMPPVVKVRGLTFDMLKELGSVDI